jgi:hypothetical protein
VVISDGIITMVIRRIVLLPFVMNCKDKTNSVLYHLENKLIMQNLSVDGLYKVHTAFDNGVNYIIKISNLIIGEYVFHTPYYENLGK